MSTPEITSETVHVGAASIVVTIDGPIDQEGVRERFVKIVSFDDHVGSPPATWLAVNYMESLIENMIDPLAISE